MRRHYGNYLKGLPNVKEVRLRLCTERDPAILEEILDEVKGCTHWRWPSRQTRPSVRGL
jgi:hypothetical protein